jgi:hypothetical protein
MERGGGDPDHDVRAYAAIAGELGGGGRPRAAVLADHGLDEASWTALDDAWQARLSAAIDQADDGVPPLVAAYTEALTQALQRGEPGVLSLERYAETTRALERSGGDVAAALSKQGVTLAQFLKANAHWARRMVEDPAVAQRFAALRTE